MLPGNVFWKEVVPKEEKTVKISPLEFFIKRIDEALDSGKLDMSFSMFDIAQDVMLKGFQDRVNDLHKIRQLEIQGKDLPAVALLFEKSDIEALNISGEFDDE